MNIRISPESVRIRVNLEEAQVLKEEGVLSQKVRFFEGEMTMEVEIIFHQGKAIKFFYTGWCAKTVLREAEFLRLLEAKPDKENRIVDSIDSSDFDATRVIFEIDLFAKKVLKGGNNE